MTSRLLATLAVLIYAVGVPLLEINETHVFNPAWPSHARLHEVWQLGTNSGLGLLALWQVWGKGEFRWQLALCLAVTAGFLVAFALQDAYGGSMRHIDSSERRVLGLNIGVIGFVLALAAAATAERLAHRRPTG